VQEQLFTSLIRKQFACENPRLGMVGLATLSTGQTLPLQNGVEVTIIGKPYLVESGALRVELKAGRRFRITGELENASEGWTQARVVFLNSEREAEDEKRKNPMSPSKAVSFARQLTAPNMQMDGKSLVDRWIELARQLESNLGQFDQLLKDLGEISSENEPSERAFWIGALINPLPGMGVAMEIRPTVLMARTAEERISVVHSAVLASIKHMDGSAPLF
jgi:Lon protease-like protein